jgi:hypothetical protein
MRPLEPPYILHTVLLKGELYNDTPAAAAGSGLGAVPSARPPGARPTPRTENTVPRNPPAPTPGPRCASRRSPGAARCRGNGRQGRRRESPCPSPPARHRGCRVAGLQAWPTTAAARRERSRATSTVSLRKQTVVHITMRGREGTLLVDRIYDERIQGGSNKVLFVWRAEKP